MAVVAVLQLWLLPQQPILLGWNVAYFSLTFGLTALSMTTTTAVNSMSRREPLGNFLDLFLELLFS